MAWISGWLAHQPPHDECGNDGAGELCHPVGAERLAVELAAQEHPERNGGIVVPARDVSTHVYHDHQ
jgi:hypothetical protein